MLGHQAAIQLCAGRKRGHPMLVNRKNLHCEVERPIDLVPVLGHVALNVSVMSTGDIHLCNLNVLEHSPWYYVCPHHAYGCAQTRTGVLSQVLYGRQAKNEKKRLLHWLSLTKLPRKQTPWLVGTSSWRIAFQKTSRLVSCSGLTHATTQQCNNTVI